MTMAVAGRIDNSRAKVERVSRAMASWSVTYGMTDEQMPTPIPASNRRRLDQRRHRSDDSYGGDPNDGREHREPESIDTLAFPVSDAVPEHDVGDEQAGVSEGEDESERLARDPNVCQQVHPTHRKPERHEVSGLRTPSAASTSGPRNSIAPTVPSGSLSMAR